MIQLGNRLEMFVDRFLIDQLQGARLELAEPRPAGVALTYEQPWEGPHHGYTTVFQDGDRFRMYYRASVSERKGDKGMKDGYEGEFTCYAESCDGVKWEKPKLGLYEVLGTKKNNVVLANDPPYSTNFSPFLDGNPACPPGQRYKAVAGMGSNMACFRKGWLPKSKAGLFGFGAEHWTSRSNKPVLGILQTGPAEISVYVLRKNGQIGRSMERMTLRLDGFASVRAPYDGGEMITKPFTFEGGSLVLNYSTSAAGSLPVEVRGEDGRAIEGFALDDCPEIIGDEIERVVTWKNDPDVSKVAGKNVRLRFLMKDADLYSFRFRG